ncbi:MAG TPA: helix-turn-helix domain-containing protein [Thermoplasmata archaeon]
MSEARVRANALFQEALGPGLARIGGALRDLGLSGNAANAFCALVRTGRATAGELVVKTGIPDSKIYYALGELADKGLIEVQEGKPKVYRVVSPREVEARLARIVDEDYERRRASTARLRSILEPLGVAASSPTADIAYIVKGLPNVVTRAQGLISSARKEIVLLASEESLFRKLEGDLVKATRRRVRLKLAIPAISVEKDLEKVAEVRSIVCDCMLLVVDGQQVLTVTRTSDNDGYAITSTDGTLVRLGLEYWESPHCCVM